MKILMQNRYDALTKKGGDSFQMLLTKKYLEKTGTSVDVSTELNPDLNGYDIIHLFNITRVHETFIQFRNAKKNNKKIVLSPIYHSIFDIRNYENKNLTGIYKLIVKYLYKTDNIQLFKTLYYVHKYPKIWYSWITQFYKGYTNQQREILKNVDFILPNSNLEMSTIMQELFNLEDIKLNYEITCNGVEDIDYVESRRVLDLLNKNNLKNYVLCPGRIEPRKNQLNIIKALIEEKIPIIFVGGINRMHGSYFKEFLKQINRNKNLFYLGEFKQEEMNTFYKYAKVTVLASWFETTGLVGIEGGIMDCNVVMTIKGYTKEYYGDLVWYCDPENLTSIKEAVLSSYSVNRGVKKLSSRIKKMFTWENAARKTLEIYKKLV